MTVDMSIVALVLNASLVVQGVMLLLVVVSILSWTVILYKHRTLKRAREAAETFERRFWSGGDLGALFTQINTRQQTATGLESLFQAGFKEFARQRRQPHNDPGTVVESADRAMRVAMVRELDTLERSLPFLATVGSVSPYVGLFGTVWGIMNAFRALGTAQQATLAMVAPGIAEALIATALGLFAAIPAVVAYNRYLNEVEKIANRYDNFREEFSTILQRQAYGRPAEAAAS